MKHFRHNWLFLPCIRYWTIASNLGQTRGRKQNTNYHTHAYEHQAIIIRPHPHHLRGGDALKVRVSRQIPEDGESVILRNGRGRDTFVKGFGCYHDYVLGLTNEDEQ